VVRNVELNTKHAARATQVERQLEKKTGKEEREQKGD